jgi:hypothetical protein
LYGEFKPPSPSKAEIKKMLFLGGAEVLKTLPRSQKKDKNTVLLCDVNYLRDQEEEGKKLKSQYNLKPINVLWILDSISNYDVLNVEEYVIHGFDNED